jgi:hypothetical protein
MARARWKDLVVDARQPGVVGAFWGEVLGLTLEVHDEGDAVLRGEQPGQTIWINRVPEPKQVKNRVHLDLVRDAYGPLVADGARVVDDHETSAYRWTVLADVEGNELCVFPGDRGEPTALVVDAADPVAQAAWWADVLGAEVTDGPDGAPRWVTDVTGLPWDVWKFVGVEDPKSVKNRWHWDVVTDDVDGLVARGATVVRRRDDEVDWDVLADPEGNEFCAFLPAS